jgi:hypothetical protein
MANPWSAFTFSSRGVRGAPIPLTTRLPTIDCNYPSVRMYRAEWVDLNRANTRKSRRGFTGKQMT